MVSCLKNNGNPSPIMSLLYQGANNFLEVVIRFPFPHEKIFIFQYHNELKTKVLHYRKLQLNVEGNARKSSAEWEAKVSLANSSSTPTDYSKDKGKSIDEYPTRSQPSSTL